MNAPQYSIRFRCRSCAPAVCLAFAALACAVLLPLRLFAAETYSIQRWEAAGEAGLPQNTVTAVLQTRDGYLWLGTYSGLVRFDGVRFTVFDDNNAPGLASSRVTSLFEADDGTLWIGHETGEVSRYRAGSFEAVPFKASGQGGKIQELATDEHGDLWALNADGALVRLRDGLTLMPEAGTTANLVLFTRSPRGTIWVTRNGRVSVLKEEQLVPLDFREAGKNRVVYGIAACRDGALWVAGDGKLRRWTGDGWTADVRPMPRSNSSFLRLIETRKGNLAAATSDQGAYLIPPGNVGITPFNRTTGFPSDWVTSLCEDREGNLWAGTGGGGLAVVRPAIFKTIAPPDQWQGRAVLATCPTRDGALWVGTEGAGLYRLQNGSWTNFAASAGISNPYVWSVAEDSRDGLWVGTWNSGLLLRRGELFDRVDGTGEGAPHMTAILCSERGGLWVGTGAGLMRYEGGRVAWHGRGQTPGQADVRSVAESPDGTVWFGMSGGGLGCLQPDGQLRYYRRADGLSSDYLGCLRLEADGTLWIGTLGGGLTRLKNGHFTAINRNQGLPNGFICHIEDDGHGFYWMSSHAGIIRASKRELNQCADGELPEIFCRTFGLAEGLPTLKCSDGLQPAGCKTSDGRLWFSTSRGLVTVDPAEVATNSLPPPTLIESLQLDNERMMFNSGTPPPLDIGPGQHRLEFFYTGLSFIGPEKMRFKYRLRGLDDAWTTVGNVRSVNYNFVPPGSYAFEVLACNSDGVWSESPARMGFTVRPHFWQTTWFRVAGGVASVVLAGGIVWFVTRQRMRRKLERLEHQRAVEDERARIARDIHDDLGATLTRITMLSDPARGETGDTTAAVSNVGHIHRTARELTRSMDEIVWAINPQHDTLDSLGNYLEKFAQDFLGTAGVRCRLDMPLQFPDVHLSAEMRHSLFLAFKEALHNVVKHSGATLVRVTLALEASAFTLTVEDNGHGFATGNGGPDAARDSSRPAGGNGLANMRRRLAKIGGHCDVQSSPGLGTKVIFSVSTGVATT